MGQPPAFEAQSTISGPLLVDRGIQPIAGVQPCWPSHIPLILLIISANCRAVRGLGKWRLLEGTSIMNKKIGWRDVCPTCTKYDHPDHQPDCEHCREAGVTEDVLCQLTRMDQEEDPTDFQCDAYAPKQSLQ